MVVKKQWIQISVQPEMSPVSSKNKKTKQRTFNSLIISCCIHSVIIPIFMLPEAMGETSKTFSYRDLVCCMQFVHFHSYFSTLYIVYCKAT